MLPNIKGSKSCICDNVFDMYSEEPSVGAGANPLDLITAKSPSTSPVCDTTGEEDGLMESIRFLLLHDDYSKPWSEEHILATMLMKAY